MWGDRTEARLKARGEFDHDQFSKVLAYYRECLRYDADRSVSLRKSDEGVTFVPLKLKSEWTLSGKDPLEAPVAGGFASDLSQRGLSADLMYAYPLLATPGRNRELELLPVFLQPVLHEVVGDRLSVRLSHDWPEVNDAFCSAIGVRSPEEKAQLYNYLGLTGDEEHLPRGLSDFVRRLAERPGLLVSERLNPECIPQEPKIGHTRSAGMLNRHLLVITERPNFTRGLEHELEALSRDYSFDRASKTALRYFFGVETRYASVDDSSATSERDITEVVPLNEEQRSAVQSAFSNDLTVVTGPPGTGKSQIVTTVLANAWLRQQSVLFASFNHKAVDVVEDRVNRLSSTRLMIRMGRRAVDRDLRDEIVNFLSTVLAFNVRVDDRLAVRESQRDVEGLLKDRAMIWANLEDIQKHRKRAFQLDNQIRGLKTERAKLECQYGAVGRERAEDEECLYNQVSKVLESAKKLKGERDAAQVDRDQKIDTISEEIEDLRTAADYVRRTDHRFGKDDEVGAAFFADMYDMYAEQDSLRQQRAIASRTRDAKIEHLKNQQERLEQDFDARKRERQSGQDLVALRGMVQEAHCIVARERDRTGSIWSKIWRGLRRSAALERVARLSDAWSDEYDILGHPPSEPVRATDLERWAIYLSDSLNRLTMWEQAIERNRELAIRLERVETEIAEVEADFAANDFDLRAAQVDERIFKRKQSEIASLFDRIKRNRNQVTKVDEALARMRFNDRIVEKYSEIEDLKREHKSRFDARFAELDAKLADNRRKLEDLSRKFATATADLSKFGKVNDLATNLRRVEHQLWDAGERMIGASLRVLPDRFDVGTRREIGAFQSLFQRLRDDELGGSTFWELMNQMDQLFPKILRVLPAWCVTNLSARHNVPFEPGMFDLVVVDEASQCSIPSALPLLYRAKRAMIIGDPNQLRHITKIGNLQDQKLQEKHELNAASDLSFGYGQESLYDVALRNVGSGSLRSLREHFRSHRDIVGFSNRHWYRGDLEVCTDHQDFQVPDSMEPGIRWDDIKGRTERQSNDNGIINREEAESVSDQVVDLIKFGGFTGSVGVVTPFRAQANLIRSILNDRLDLDDMRRCELITNTAHRFQGDERDVMFFSPCVGHGMSDGAHWFLANTGYLFNVAITRPRALLVVVGNLEACLASEIPHVKEFAEFYNNTLEGKDSTDISSGFVNGTNIGHWERPFYDALIAEGLKPMHQYVEGQYRLDFAFVTDKMKLNVEVDGEMYHREWDGSRSRVDLMRDHRLMGMGWQIKRFWVYELRDDMERCVAETKELLL